MIEVSLLVPVILLSRISTGNNLTFFNKTISNCFDSFKPQSGNEKSKSVMQSAWPEYMDTVFTGESLVTGNKCKLQGLVMIAVLVRNGEISHTQPAPHCLTTLPETELFGKLNTVSLTGRRSTCLIELAIRGTPHWIEISENVHSNCNLNYCRVQGWSLPQKSVVKTL